MDIVNPNYLNYMEQIQKNRKDIENLYEQELRDITQLNFKENDVNGLQYTNGKAIFNGKSTIIRDESIENLEVDSKVELKISSRDNNIVIGAGEDNSTLEIHLDNGTITTLDFAESERQKSQTDGAIVHEKEIADVEHIETIYDMSSSDSNINKGYTSGLQFSGTTSYNIMEQPQKNKYKCFRATAHLVNTDLIFEFMNNVDGYARGGFSCQAHWEDNSQICAGNISIAPWGGIPLSNCIIQSGSTVTSKMDDTSYYISKIEGVLL